MRFAISAISVATIEYAWGNYFPIAFFESDAFLSEIFFNGNFVSIRLM